MRIYVDMDQVLSNFLLGVENLLGYPFESQERGDLIVGSHPTFWEDLPPMDDYRELWGYVRPFDPYILSAYPKWNDVHVYEGKRKWLQKYLDVSMDRVHIVARREKQNFATIGGTQNLLIDDREKNIREFTEAGGIGVLHTSAHTTIQQLQQLGIIPLVSSRTS